MSADAARTVADTCRAETYADDLGLGMSAEVKIVATTAMGTALAREIAEAHGGRIALANRDGGGLSVAITLPD